MKDKKFFILSQTLLILFMLLILKILKAPKILILLVCLFAFFIGFIGLVYEYIYKNNYYKRLFRTLTQLDKKTLIAEVMESAEFVEGEILKDVLKTANKSMNDEIAIFSKRQNEYQEYIETWIHEIKIPISTISLICENNKNDLTVSIFEELKNVEKFVEQALYYARSNAVEKDYTIRECKLEALVKNVVKKQARQLIACKCKLGFHGIENVLVYSDGKWLDFIFGQIISNSIKYCKEEFSLIFSVKETESSVALIIEDNGIGIAECDIGRVFDKGFTGENGRAFGKSTGMGLYLCKDLCEKLHLSLELESQVDIGTAVKIIFPKDKAILFE